MRGFFIIAALAAFTASCQNECPDGLTDCSGRGGLLCVDLLNDDSDCGECDNACEPGHVCEVGVCTLSCLEGYTDCDGVCRDLMTDPYNCGWCSLACVSGYSCVDGVCTRDD